MANATTFKEVAQDYLEKCEREGRATQHHAAVTDPEEVGLLLRTIDTYTGQEATRMALRPSAHLFVRPGELRQAEWSEIDFEKAGSYRSRK